MEEAHHQEFQAEVEGKELDLQEVAVEVVLHLQEVEELHVKEVGVVLACHEQGEVVGVGLQMEEAEVALHALGEGVEEGLLILEEVGHQTLVGVVMVVEKLHDEEVVVVQVARLCTEEEVGVGVEQLHV